MKKNNILPIGTKVIKRSRCKFMSGLKVNTISGVTTNPYCPGRPAAYTFEEDLSVVNTNVVKECKQ